MIRFFVGFVTIVVFFIGMMVGASFPEATMGTVKALGSLFTWIGS